VSQSTRDFLVKERFVPAERVRVIWNGAPLDEFAPVPRERALKVRRALALPEDALVVGTIGRLNAQKGHRFLLDAAALLLPRRPEARVLVAGDGDLMGDLRRQATDLGVADRVVFAGHRTDVPDLLGALDVFCIASLYEGTPLALFEAMAAERRSSPRRSTAAGRSWRTGSRASSCPRETRGRSPRHSSASSPTRPCETDSAGAPSKPRGATT